MSNKSYYLSQERKWANTQTDLNTKASRLRTALSSLNTQIGDFKDNKDDYERKYKKLDDGSGADDWEGQRVSNVRTKCKNEVTAKYTTISGQYEDVATKMQQKINDYTQQAKSAGDKSSEYGRLAAQCDDDDD